VLFGLTEVARWMPHTLDANAWISTWTSRVGCVA
jgi:hypothetical protein